MKFHPPNHSFFEGVLSDATGRLPDVEVFLHQSGKANPKVNSILVADQLEPNEVISQFQAPELRHFVQKNEAGFAQNLLSAARLVENPSPYFESEFSFFPDQKIESELIRFAGPDDKENLKKTFLAFVSKIKSPGVTESADAIVEELYMNAIKDAPFEANKRGWPLTSRPSELFLCRSQKWLQISCMDYFGSLDPRKVLDRMHEVYTQGAGVAINMNVSNGAGAGLGSFILFERSVCLILGVLRGQKTKVSCFIPLEVNNRERTRMKKSLHWFEI